MVYSLSMSKATSAIFTSMVTALVLAAGCAATPDSSASVIQTLREPGLDGFSNILVVGVAGDYPSRAAFEADLARSVSSETVTAQPYYTVVGRRPQLTRALLLDAIRVRGFDAVLFTRLQGQERADLAPQRPVGRAFDLFSYDYAELNRDEAIREASAHTFVSELYATATQAKVWSIETLSVDKETAAALIEEQVRTIAAQLREDGLLGR